MKKFFLLAFLMAFVGVFSSQAVSVIINVDNAANVVVKGNYGYGQTLTLENGLNRLDLSDADDSPLQIKAAEGATIVSVTKNETETLTANNGEYIVRFYSTGIKLDIVTSGSGVVTSPAAKDIHFNLYVSGEGVTGKPVTIEYKKGEEWVEPTKEWGMTVVPEGSEVRITPQEPFVFKSVTTTPAIENFGTINEDGTYTFTMPGTFDYCNINVVLKPSDNAVKYSVTVDWPDNVTLVGQANMTGIQPGVKTDFYVLDKGGDFDLQFKILETAGAEIKQVTLNGEVQQPSGWGGSNGYQYSLNNGDVFTVSTKGAPTEVLFKSAPDNADLSAYLFTLADGTILPASGKECTLTANAGEMIYVKPRPGSNLDLTIGENTQTSQLVGYYGDVRVAKGYDPTKPMAVVVYGSRNVKGVVFEVDNAAAITAVQENGRGEALTLTNGQNNLVTADIKNAVSIKAAEGWQIVTTELNGEAVQPNAAGEYLVNVKESDWVGVKTRKAPVEAALTFKLPEGAKLTWLTAAIEGTPTVLTSPMTLETYTTLDIAPCKAYEITELTCDNPKVTVTPMIGDGSYRIYISDPEVTAAEIKVNVQQRPAKEGCAWVSFKFLSMPGMFKVYEKEMVGEELKMVKVLENPAEDIYEVPVGHYIEMLCMDTQSMFKFVKANGTDVTLEPRVTSFSEYTDCRALIKIEGLTEIEAQAFTPLQVSCDETYDEIKHIVCGRTYIDVNGENKKMVYGEAGQVIKLVAVPEPGYIFDHFEMFYPLTMKADGIKIEGDTYTLTEEDATYNFIMFKGVFKVDENNKSYALEGTTAWLPAVGADGTPDWLKATAVGNVVFPAGDDNFSRHAVGQAGDEIELYVAGFEESFTDLYEVDFYCLMQGFPNSTKLPVKYTINPDDANDEGVIWISAAIKQKGSGINGIHAEGLTYDAAAKTVYAQGAVEIFNLNGELVAASAEGEVNIAGLPAGLYIARANGQVIKFAK